MYSSGLLLRSVLSLAVLFIKSESPFAHAQLVRKRDRHSGLAITPVVS